jgi:hypothetical protein
MCISDQAYMLDNIIRFSLTQIGKCFLRLQGLLFGEDEAAAAADFQALADAAGVSAARSFDQLPFSL